jgi:hypothetical protein
MINQAGDHPNRVFCAGSSLCGKSYLAGKLAQDYQKNNKGNPVVLFSWVDKDPAYGGVSNLKKIRIDDSILENPIQLEELQDSLCIFDDIHHFTDKHIREELERIRDSCFNAGRHKGIATICASQNLLEGNRTKTPLNSGFQIIGYPRSAGRYQFQQFLKRYMFMGDNMIRKIMSTPSRWVLLNRANPMYVLGEKCAYFLD